MQTGDDLKSPKRPVNGIQVVDYKNSDASINNVTNKTDNLWRLVISMYSSMVDKHMTYQLQLLYIFRAFRQSL